MSQLTGVTTAGTGLVGVILPDTTSSSRYVDFDLPYLTKAFTTAGYATTDFKIDNAGGVDATQLSMAQADITAGAKVLLVDPIDGTVGNQIQTAAAAAGVTMISYDRATFQGTNTYYVSFDNVQVGKLIGQGLMDCVTAWGVTNPQVFELDGGEDTDPNAISFAAGLQQRHLGHRPHERHHPQRRDHQHRPATRSSATRSPRAGTTPRAVRSSPQAYTANSKINATVEANDGLANAVITALKAAGVPAKKIPTTGQDATPQGMESILQGFQCGSVYKPIYLEAQAAVALATYLRAGQTPPTALVNGTTDRSEEQRDRRAGSPRDPGLGGRHQHGGDRHHRQVRLRHGPVQGRRS